MEKKKVEPNKQPCVGSRFIGLVAVIPLLFLSALGCGSGNEKVMVSGTVAFDGKPMPDGYVIFTPEGGGTPAAGPISNGKFSFLTSPGTHRVEIEASQFVGPKNAIMGLQPREQYVPARYNSASTLRREVTQDSNMFDFSLSSKEKE
jgi:hypothetical protein